MNAILSCVLPRRGYRFRDAVKELSEDDWLLLVNRKTRTSRRTTIVEDDEAAPHDSAVENSPPQLVGTTKNSRRKFMLAAVAALALVSLVALFYFWRARPAAVTPEIKSLAVLPLQNASGDEQLNALSESLSESLIERLSQLQQLKVIARSSSFRFKGKEIDPQQVGKTLGVQSLLTGSLTKRGDSLVINVELVDARDGSRVWGEQYNIGAADTQAVEGRIARRTAEKLQLDLTQTQGARLVRNETENLQAYQLYLNGVLLRRKSSRLEDAKKAVEYYR